MICIFVVLFFIKQTKLNEFQIKINFQRLLTAHKRTEKQKRRFA